MWTSVIHFSFSSLKVTYRFYSMVGAVSGNSYIVIYLYLSPIQPDAPEISLKRDQIEA